MIDINPFEYSAEGHTLTVAFIDERGSVGTFQYNFTGQTREGENSIECTAER